MGDWRSIYVYLLVSLQSAFNSNTHLQGGYGAPGRGIAMRFGANHPTHPSMPTQEH